MCGERVCRPMRCRPPRARSLGWTAAFRIVSSPHSGHRRFQRYVELAGIERGVEAALRQFLLVLVLAQWPDERRLDRPYGVIIQVWIVREEDLRDERLVSFCLHLEMYVRRTPRVLAGGLKQPAHRPIRRDRVRFGHHRLKLVAAVLVDAEPSPKVVVRLPLIPEVVAAIRARLPDIEDRTAYRGAVRGGDPAVHEEYISVLCAFILFVDLHRLLPPGWVLSIERSFHVAGCDVSFAFVGDCVYQYRSLGDVGEQDKFVLSSDLS